MSDYGVNWLPGGGGGARPRIRPLSVPRWEPPQTVSVAPSSPSSISSYAPTVRKRISPGSVSGSLASDPNFWADEPEGPPSLLGQITGLVPAVGQGIVGLGKDVVGTAAGVGVKLPADVFKSAMPFIGGGLNAGEGGVLGAIERYMPISGTMGQSFANTGMRVAHPSRYLQSIKQGTIVGDVLEDVANVSLVGGAVAPRVLGRAPVLRELPAAQAEMLYGAKAAPAGAMVDDLVSAARREAPVTAPRPSTIADYVPPPKTVIAADPGTGLAGYVGRRGNLTRATQLEAVGTKARSVFRMGERVGEPSAWITGPSRWVGRKMEAAGLGRYRPIATALPKALAVAGPKFSPLYRFTEPGRKLTTAKAKVERSGAGIQRYAYDPLREAKRHKLTDTEASAALSLVDDLMFPAVDTLRRENLTDAEFTRVVDDAYKGVPEAMRPTADTARVVYAFLNDELPAPVMTGMRAVASVQAKIAENRTAERVASGLDPEHLGEELRPSVIGAEQWRLERRRTNKLREWEKNFGPTVKAERLAHAQAVVREQLPAPSGAVPQGDPRFLKINTMLRNEYRKVSGELVAATKAYEQLPDTADTPSLQQAANRVDEATARKVEIADAITSQETRAGVDRWTHPPEGPARTRAQAAWQRRRGRPSPAERIVDSEAVSRERLRQREARSRNIRRSIDRLNKEIGDVPVELGRSVQERLVTEHNRRAINGLRTSIRKGAQRLGGPRVRKVQTKAGVEMRPFVDGLLGKIARQHGVEPDLLAALEATDMSPREMGAALETLLEEQGVVLDAPTRQALEDAVGADQLLYDIQMVLNEQKEPGQELNVPYRVRDMIDASEWNMPAEVRTDLARKVSRYESKRARFLMQNMDKYFDAIPAQYRSTAQAAKRHMGSLIELAEEYNQKSPGSGDHLLREAAETVTTLDGLIKAGVNPTHLIGGMPPSKLIRPGGMTTKNVRGEKHRTTGLRAQSLAAYARLEANEAASVVNNRNVEYFLENFGVRVENIPEVVVADRDFRASHNGEPMPAADMQAVAEANGYKVAKGRKVQGGQTLMFPAEVHRQLFTWAESFAQTIGMRGLAKANQWAKNVILPFSPKWVSGNIVGGAVQASGNAGVTPNRLVKRMLQIKNHAGGFRGLWDETGLPPGLPPELSSHGLSHSEYADYMNMDPEHSRRLFNRFMATSYRFNEMVDNWIKGAVYLDKVGDGVPTERSVKVAQQALGDFTRMSSVERHIFRQIVPFYSWLRHQTTAAMRLPIYSPVRAAWLLHLADMYGDPEYSQGMLEMIRGRIPLGGDRFFDPGNWNPYPTLNELPLFGDPEATAFSISPALKLAGLPFGLDVARLRQYTRPTGTISRGPWQEEKATHPNFLESAYIMAGELPPTKMLRDLAMGPSTIRYQTGQPRDLPPDENRNWLSTILQGMRIPGPTTIDLEEIARREREARWNQ